MKNAVASDTSKKIFLKAKSHRPRAKASRRVKLRFEILAGTMNTRA